MDLKIIILLNYFDRPVLVRGFLRSLVVANRQYSNWELAFIDDGSEEAGRPIVERVLKNEIHKVHFYNSNMTKDMKAICGGSYMGKFMNQALMDTDADVAIIAGDDDEIYPDYLRNLNEYFQVNPNVLSCYSRVHVFDPFREKTCNTNNLYSDDPKWKGHTWFGKPINCAYRVDGIQVAWRLSCNKVWGAKFKFPIITNIDAEYFEELYDRCGPSVYSGFISMYKGRHEGQLIRRIEQSGDPSGNKVKVLDRPQDVLFL